MTSVPQPHRRAQRGGGETRGFRRKRPDLRRAAGRGIGESPPSPAEIRCISREGAEGAGPVVRESDTGQRRGSCPPRPRFRENQGISGFAGGRLAISRERWRRPFCKGIRHQAEARPAPVPPSPVRRKIEASASPRDLSLKPAVSRRDHGFRVLFALRILSFQWFEPPFA